MTKRLVLGLLAVIGGSALAVAGTRMAWYTIHQRGRSVDIAGLGETFIDKVPRMITGSDVASWTTPIAALMLVGGLLAALVGPRVRPVALALVVAGAPVLLYAWLALGAQAALDALPVTAGEAVTTRVTRGAGSLVTSFGALAAGVGALWCWPAARGVPRFGMPEAPSVEPESETDP